MEKMQQIKIRDLLKSKETGKEYLVRGWVRTKRGNKNINFIALNDGSVIHNIQVVAEVSKFSEDLLKQITTGACIGVKGILVDSPASGQPVELKANEIVIYGTSDADDLSLAEERTFP